MLFATIGYVLLPSAVVWANPTGEQVVGGSATFERQGNTLTVNQATDRLAVNWQDFSIAAGETTHFNMPSSASIALNRVLGGNPSQIYGTLSSNGNIILVNNAGIFVGPGGVVNAASFVGSTLDIDPTQFMNAGQGGYHLHGDSYAPIVNQGNITAEKGDVFLIAQKVENRGTISAPNGRAALVGAGRAADRTEVVLHEVGGAGFAVRVTQLEGEAAQGLNGDLPDGEELLNEGEIAAAQAELNASGNIYALAIKNSGIIRAKAVVAQADGTVRLDGGLGDVRNTGTLIAKNAGDEATAAGGTIEVTGQNVTASPESILTAAGGLQGGDGGKVKIDSDDTTIVQGKVDVAAPSAGAKGGKVELLGERVGLFDGAKVDASGGAGGGTVLAGGDYLGGQAPKPELVALAKQEKEPVKNAKATVMAETAEIKADATVNGDGGKIILWSDEYTGFYGQLFARGGAEGGNGGFMETSSKDNLQAFGGANASAFFGKAGLWLIDPANVVITASTPANMTAAPNFAPTANNGQVSAAVVNTQLGLGTSVTITTSGAGTQVGDIVVEAAIAPAAESAVGASLTLTADRNIIVAAPITLRGGNLTMTAGIAPAATPVPTGIIAVNAALSTTGGIGIAGGNVSLNTGASGSIELGANITTVSTAAFTTVTANNSGSINFNTASVLLTANVTLDAGQERGGSINFGNTTSSLNSPFTLTISTQSGDINFGGAIGAGTVAGALPLGGLLIRPGTGTTTLNGNVFTSGGNTVFPGGVNLTFGTPVALGAANITIDTTRLGNFDGGAIRFDQTLSSASTARSLTLLGGAAGQLRFGGNVSNLSGFTVTSGLSVNVDNGSTFTIAGPIAITPVLATTGGSLTMTTTGAGNGITLGSGADFSSVTAGRDGGSLILTSAGAVNVNGTILSLGFTPPNLPGVAGPGSNGGTITISGTTVTTQNVILSGGGGTTTGRGGAGGTLSLTATSGNVTLGAVEVGGGAGAGGGNGGAAGSVILSASGSRVLSGSITASGGAGNGAGQGGAAASLTFGDVRIGAPNVAITAVGGANGAGTGRGADGVLTFSGIVTGTTAGANSLEIDVDAGTVTFSGAVGTVLVPLGQITIQNARNVTFSSSLDARRFVQNGSVPAGGIFAAANQEGTTTFSGLVTLTSTGTAVDFTGYNLFFGNLANLTATSGSFAASLNGVLTANSPINLGVDFTLAGGGLAGASPRLDLAAGITSGAGAFTFGTPANPVDVRLLQDLTLNTGGGGEIFFGGLVDSGVPARSLTLTSGGAVTFNGLVGSLGPLSNLTTSTTGSTVFAAAGTRAIPSVNLSGTINLQNQAQLNAGTVWKANGVTLAAGGLIDGAQDLLVLLNAGTFTLNGQVGGSTPLNSLRVEGGSIALDFAGSQASPSVSTTGNQYYGRAVSLGADTVLNAGSLDFLSTIDGARSLLLDSAGDINLYGRVGSTALTQFQTAGGGTLNLLATGTSAGSPTIRTSGAQLFSSRLVLGEDTFLTSTAAGNDFIFLDPIDSRLANQPRSLTVSGQGRVVLEAPAGAGFRLQSASLTGLGNVAVLAGINTFGGAITLQSTGGSVVLSGNTDTGVSDQLGGGVNLLANTQVLLNGGIVNTFGGTVAFNTGVAGSTFIQTATTLNTTGGVSNGSITFNNALNGLANLTLTAGQGTLSFGAIGSTNPFGLLVNSSGAVTLNGTVLMGGNFTFNNLSGTFTSTAAATIDSAVELNSGDPYTLLINPVNPSATLSFRAIGSVSPLRSFIVGSGGGLTTLNGNISTAGGAVNLEGAVSLANSIAIDTTRLGFPGAGVNFLGAVNGSVANTQDLTITAGTGAVTFGGRVGGTAALRDLTINSGGSLSFTDAADLNVSRDILVVPAATSVNNMTMTAGRNVEFRQGITARPNNGAGRNLTINATAGSVIVGGTIDVSGRSGTFIGFAPDGSTFTFATAGAQGGRVTLNANSITTGAINANGSDNFVTGGNGGNGGAVTLTSSTDLVTGPINVSGGTDGDLGGVGGSITLTRSSATGNVRVGTLSAVGGASNEGVGAAGGTIRISATLGNLSAPTDFFARGGSGSEGFVAGQGGTVTLEAVAGSLSFANSELNLAGDVVLSVSAGTHLILATVPDFTTPGDSTGGVVITLNTDAPRLDRRGSASFAYGSANTGGTFFMPSSSYVISNGGDIRVDVKDIAGGSGPGGMTLAGLTTSGANVGGGRILLNENPGAGGVGAVTVLGSLDTSGGIPTTPAYGRSGGSVYIAGTTVSVGAITTTGSGSLATATTPAFGGAGGDIEISGSSGITLRRGLTTAGGVGLGTGDANGGGGGNILLAGNVTLSSGSSANTTIRLDTQGGLFAGAGDYGLGGNVTLTGTLTGTPSTSNILDLRYGSGTVTLGDAAADTITLGTLITAADDARSTGSLVVNGKLVVDTLVTYARGYSVSLFGAGTQFGTLYTFLNTGTVGLGSAGDGVTFLGGFNSAAAGATKLNGLVTSGSAQSPNNGGNMTMGAVILSANSTLNSNGNDITLTTIDDDSAVAGTPNLEFASGIGATGTVTIAGAVGSLNPVGTVTVSSAGPVTFGSFFNGTAIVTAAGTTTRFNGGTSVTGAINGITTTGASSLGGTVTLVNSLYASDTTQVFKITSNGAFAMPGTVTLSGGPFELAGTGGSFTLAGTLSGAQPLTLSGTTTKTFNGTLAVGNGTTAITATGGAVTFGGTATLSGASTFGNSVTLSGTLLASGPTSLNGGLTLAGGGGTLGGAGAYSMTSITDVGATRILTYSGSGGATISGVVNLGSIIGSGSGSMIFNGASVTSATASSFLGLVRMGGVFTTTSGRTSFSAIDLAGATTFAGDLSASGVLTGNGSSVTLSDASDRQFASATGLGNLSVSGGSTSFSSSLGVGVLSHLGGTLSLSGTTTVTGAATLGAITTLNGISFSAASVSLTGTANSSGNSSITGLVTLGAAGDLNSTAAGGVLTLQSGLALQRDFTMDGAGSYTVQGSVTRDGFARALTFDGGGVKTFSGNVGASGSSLGDITQLIGSGDVTFGGNVFGGVVDMRARTIASGNVEVDSGAAKQSYQSMSLNGDLTAITAFVGADAITLGAGGVNGSGNILLRASNASAEVKIDGLVANTGTFDVRRAGQILLGAGLNPYLDAAEVARIRSSGGAAFVSTLSSVQADTLTANTGLSLGGATTASASGVTASALSLQAGTGAATADSVTVSGDLGLTSTSGGLVFTGSSTAGSVGLDGTSVTDLEKLTTPRLGSIRLTAGGLDYRPGGNLTVAGPIRTSGEVVLAPSGNFVNAFQGNPFTAPGVKITTQDFFSYPASAGVPGLLVRYGITGVGQLGNNQIGVAKPLLAGSGGPFITEFTTGTGQPYILATQNNAVPPVFLPVALPGTAAGAFAARPTFSQEEIEMMTPEERSAFEAGRRQQATRVLLERTGGEEQQIGLPAEGEIPQAKGPEVAPPAPTAQVFLNGQPLASKQEKDKQDSTQWLRGRPARSVVLEDPVGVLFNERVAAEVNMGAVPLAGN